MSLDLVIRGGMVFDGSGGPRFRSDIGVRDGRIVELGRITETGATEIDADGLFVMPGIIDGHVHLDAQVNWDPLGPSAWHGVTTAVMGNCGFTLAPGREAEKSVIFSVFERAEDLPTEALVQGLEWKWETFAEWLEHLRALPKGINYASQIGHSALRAYVMGERCFDEAATDDDIAAMCRELESAIAAGAIGLSSSRSQHHFCSDDRPVPSRQASWKELGALIETMAGMNRGMCTMNTQGEAQHPDADRAERFHRLVNEWALLTRRPFVNATPLSHAVIYDDANAAGARIFSYWMPKPFDSVTGFRITLPFDTLPGWAAVRGLSLDEQRKVFGDPDRRAALVHEAMTNRSGSERNTEARPPEYDILEVLTAGIGPYKSVAELADERRTTPVDVMIDLSLDSDFEQLFSQNLMSVRPTAEEYRALARNPRTVWGISDSGAHVASSLGYDNSTYFLANWVREEGVFTWEEGIRLLTFEPACVWGFNDRGLVREGYAADLLVIDPDELGLEAPAVAHDLPGGAPRLVRKGTGFQHTIVNGVEVLRDNEPTGAHPGQVLAGFGGQGPATPTR